MNDTMLCSNISDITNALCVFQKNMQEKADLNEKVKTALSYADISAGYEIGEILISEFGIVFKVTMLDRSIRENDDTRNGDNAVFYVCQGKVYDKEEMERQSI